MAKKLKPVVEEKKAESSEEEDESEVEESEEEESEEESEEGDESSESEEEEVNIFNMPTEQLTPAQRRLRWVKLERLPLYLQELRNKKKKKKAVDVESEEDGRKAVKQQPTPISAENNEDKETILNLKIDFQIDYTKADNVSTKLLEIHEERMKVGTKKSKHHVQLLTYMLDFVKDPRLRVEILLTLLNSIFASSKTASSLGFLTREAWVGAHKLMQTLITQFEDPALKGALAGHSKKTKHTEDGTSGDGMDIERQILPSLLNFL